ncbi:hypothetical protein KC316_g3420 [Hortaea werneckii]|nr:hypothetical protein KC324_g4025 [Hortaea werneckii]KAI7590363.1 hypothetical protein KC316_g3420 [Hortaea werneckii]
MAAVSRRTSGHSGLGSDFGNLNFGSRSGCAAGGQPPKHPRPTTLGKTEKENEFQPLLNDLARRWYVIGKVKLGPTRFRAAARALRELMQLDRNAVDAFNKSIPSQFANGRIHEGNTAAMRQLDDLKLRSERKFRVLLREPIKQIVMNPWRKLMVLLVILASTDGNVASGG